MNASHAQMRAVRDLRTPLAAALTTGLALHAQVGPRNSFKAGHGNAVATHFAIPVVVGFDARQRFFDLFHRLTRRVRQCEVAFALDGQGVTLTAFLVELGVARFTLICNRLGFSQQQIGLGIVMIAFFDELQLELFKRAGCQRGPVVLR